jgi:hypothetical protein
LLYTEGEWNKLVDAAVHPMAKREPFFLLVDEALHVAVERDLPKSLKKFLRFNYPSLLRQIIDRKKGVPKNR